MNVNDSINLLQDSTDLGSIKSLEFNTIAENNSILLSESINLMCNTMNILTEVKKDLYKVIYESDNNYSVILEAFSDYYTKSVKICKDSLNFFKNEAKEKMIHLKEWINDTKEISSHKKDLEENVKYYYDSGSHEGFYYTIKGLYVPRLEALEQFNENIFDDVISSDINDLSIQSLQNSIANKDIEQSFKKFRSSILGREGTLDLSEFNKLLYSIFRNNKNETELLEIDISIVQDIIKTWFNFDEYENIIEDDLNRLEKALHSILDKISMACDSNNDNTLVSFAKLLPGNINIEYIDGIKIDNYAKKMPDDLMVQFDIYCKFKLEMLLQFNNIIWMVISAKIDAIRCMYAQYRLILLDVCRAIDKPEYKQSIRTNILISNDNNHR